MNGALADIIGLLGSAMMIGAYAYSNLTDAINFRLFNAINLVGALMLIGSLSVHFNLAAMAQEIVWALVALLGLIKTVRR